MIKSNKYPWRRDPGLSISPGVLLFIIVLFLGVNISLRSQTTPISDFFPDINIIESNDPAPGYFFLATQGVSAVGAQRYIAIVDNYGTPVFFRLMPAATVSMRLLNDGTIGYVHGVPRKLYIMDEMLDVIDTISTEGLKLDGHDWAVEDNVDYNRLVFGQYTREVDMSLLITGGNPAAIIDETIIQEFDRDNTLISSWRTEDHFDIFDGNDESPFVDFLSDGIDYAHLNSVAVWSDTSMVISTRHMDEITCIDRRTGDIIWRLGGKNNQFTFINDPEGFVHQHCPRRTENGNLILFDNGNLKEPQYSRSVEYELDMESMTATLVNSYRRTPDAFAPRDGATQRLSNGNTIATWGPGWPSVTEFNPDGTIAIELDYTEHSLSPRVEKFIWKTKIFETSVDSVDFGLWDEISPVNRTFTVKNNADTAMHITSYSTRDEYFSVVTPLPLELVPGVDTEVEISFDPTNATSGYLTDILTLNSDNSSQRIARQVYLSGRQVDNEPPLVAIMPDSINVPVDATITIQFTEPVRKDDKTELNYESIDGFLIFKKDDNNGADIAFDATINSSRDIVTLRPSVELDSGQVYFVSTLSGIEDYSGNSVVPSPTSFTTVDLTTSVSELELHTKINLFPNPTSGLFTIDFESQKSLSLEVYSSTGIKVLNKKSIPGNRFDIDISGNRPGVYFVVLRTKDNRIAGRQKIILNSR
jgi:hypothetical protein